MSENWFLIVVTAGVTAIVMLLLLFVAATEGSTWVKPWPDMTSEMSKTPSSQSRVATFDDWPKAKVGDLPPGTMFTQDGDDLLQKLNDEFQVPALFAPEGGVVGNGVAGKITDPNRVVGVVQRGGVQVWRKEEGK